MILTCGSPVNLLANFKKFWSFCCERCALSRNCWHVSNCVRHVLHTIVGNPSFGDTCNKTFFPKKKQRQWKFSLLFLDTVKNVQQNERITTKTTGNMYFLESLSSCAMLHNKQCWFINWNLLILAIYWWLYVWPVIYTISLFFASVI